MNLRYPDIHVEILAALETVSRPKLKENVAADRGSKMEYSGVRVPDRRALVKSGFSFFENSNQEIIDIWDDMWRHSTNGDVLFCALDYYVPRVAKEAELSQWHVMKTWMPRVDNWAHSDYLCTLFAYFTQRFPETVLPVLKSWNTQEELWAKRISIVSLIHGLKKNPVFLSPETMFSYLEACIDDHRHYILLATGWVLREIISAYREEGLAYLESRLSRIGALAFRRSLNRLSTEERNDWMERKSRLRRSS